MKFSDYLASGAPDGKPISRTRAAKELGKTRTYITDIANGKLTPGRKLVEAITAWSHGKVGWADFYQAKGGS